MPHQWCQIPVQICRRKAFSSLRPLTPLDGKPISCALTRRSSTFSALSCVQSPFVPPLCTTQRNRVTDSCTSIFAQTRLANSSFKRLPSTDIPSSEAKAFNALIPSLRTWRRKGSTPPSVKPCCNSRSFSDISGWSEPRVTTYKGQARYESRTKSCADQLHALTNKRNTSLQLKLANINAVLPKASCKTSNGCHTLTSPAQKLKPSMHWSQVCAPGAGRNQLLPLSSLVATLGASRTYPVEANPE